MQVKEFKVSLIGHSQTRKTTFLRNLLYGNQTNINLPKTLGVEVKPFEFHYNNTKYRLNIWDCGGEYMGLGKEYLKNSHLVVIFKHLTKQSDEFKEWVPNFCPYICVDMWKENAVINTLQNIRNTLINNI